jgi:tRNA dimethylallyltransferase
LSTLIYITGPTASGKSSLAIELALKLNAEILSSDARQIYKFMDIGTGKVPVNQRKGVVHHFLDIITPDQLYTSGRFEHEASILLGELFKKREFVILTGGSGMYAESLLYGLDELPVADPKIRIELETQLKEQGLGTLLEELQLKDPETWEKIDRKNPVRILRALEILRVTGEKPSTLRTGKRKEHPFKILALGIQKERKELYKTINNRVEEMFAEGWVEETKELLKMGYTSDSPGLNSIGYREIVEFLAGNLTYSELVETISRDTRRYAKRQMTWFRKDTNIIWDENWNPEKIIKLL